MLKIAASFAFAFVLMPTAMAEPLRIKPDQTVTLNLSVAASQIFVGNVAVVKVAPEHGSALLITGTLPGSTNILVLDKAGRVIWKGEVVVSYRGKIKLRPA